MCHVKFATIHQNFVIIIYVVYYLPIILQWYMQPVIHKLC